jgi:hypothetical protein
MFGRIAVAKPRRGAHQIEMPRIGGASLLADCHQAGKVLFTMFA